MTLSPIIKKIIMRDMCILQFFSELKVLCLYASTKWKWAAYVISEIFIYIYNLTLMHDCWWLPEQSQSVWKSCVDGIICLIRLASRVYLAGREEPPAANRSLASPGSTGCRSKRVCSLGCRDWLSNKIFWLLHESRLNKRLTMHLTHVTVQCCIILSTLSCTTEWATQCPGWTEWWMYAMTS